MGFSFEMYWPEYYTAAFFIIGFIVALFTFNPYLSYFISFICGFVAAAFLYRKHQQQSIFAQSIVTMLFFLGFILGSFWAHRLLVVIFSLSGFILSYQLHAHRIIVIFKSKSIFE